MNCIYSGISRKGNRNENQDAIFMFSKENFSVFCLADGMGGHSNGGYASNLIVERFRQWSLKEYEIYCKEKEILSNIVVRAKQLIIDINDEIYQSSDTICGSTLVVFIVYENYYAVLSVGDSRVYIKRKRKMYLLTKDDIWDNKNEVRKSLTPEQIKKHKNHNKLINAVGGKENVSIAVNTDMIKKNDSLILCSDGMYKICTKYKIKKFISKRKKETYVIKDLSKIEKYIESKGAVDNYSIIKVCFFR